MIVNCKMCCSFACENAGKSIQKNVKECCFMKEPNELQDFINFLGRRLEIKSIFNKDDLKEEIREFIKARYKE